MRIKAALEGNLEKIMQQELKDATEGVTRGVQAATDLAQAGWRAQVERAGLGQGLTKSIRKRFYPNQGMDAAGWVYAKSQRIITAFERGALVRSRRGRYLAIPTPEAVQLARRRVGRFGKVSPANWPKSLPELRYVPRRSGPALLVADELKHTSAGRLTRARRTKTGRLGRGASSVVMFILVRQTKLPKKLDVQQVTERVEALLPRLILRYYRDTPTPEK